jgi:hypothetical protein
MLLDTSREPLTSSPPSISIMLKFLQQILILSIALRMRDTGKEVYLPVFDAAQRLPFLTEPIKCQCALLNVTAAANLYSSRLVVAIANT